MNKLHAERKEWIKKRFGNIDNNILGEIKNCHEITIDKDYRESHKNKNGDILEYCIITDIGKYAPRNPHSAVFSRFEARSHFIL